MPKSVRGLCDVSKRIWRGRYGLFIGCGMLLLLLAAGLRWIMLQIAAIFRSERIPYFALAYLILFAFVPGYVVYTSLGDHSHIGGFSKLIYNTSLRGICALPLTLTREGFKMWRD